jgi:acyl-CoA carboxylase subunit beta
MTSASRPRARDLIEITLDPESFSSWDSPPNQPELGGQYSKDLETATLASGVDEAVITGEGMIEGRRVAVIVGEFGFLAGSIGVAAADRIVHAFSRATQEKLPVLAAPSSGGTRMQEGTIAFTRMIDIVSAVSSHKKAGLLYLVYLRHPTTGGVFATWGSLGQITVAEPKALIGFLGPKVYEALHGEPFPPGVQTSENLYQRGVIDAVLDAHHLRGMITRVLNLVSAVHPALTRHVSENPPSFPENRVDPWESVRNSRKSGRPGLRTLLRFAASDVIGLTGTGMGERENASLVALARFGEHGVVVVGLDRHAQFFDGPLGPGALRQARRGMALATELRLPLVTVIDTPGAALSREAEEGGLGGEIARSLATLIDIPVPTVSVVLGQGTGGPAIALFPADRVVAARHAWLSPLQPEGASVIRYGHVREAPRMAREQGISASELLAAGLVDDVIDEMPDASVEPEAFCHRVGEAIERAVSEAKRLRTKPRNNPHQFRVRHAVHNSFATSPE